MSLEGSQGCPTSMSPSRCHLRGPKGLQGPCHPVSPKGSQGRPRFLSPGVARGPPRSTSPTRRDQDVPKARYLPPAVTGRLSPGMGGGHPRVIPAGSASRSRCAGGPRSRSSGCCSGSCGCRWRSRWSRLAGDKEGTSAAVGWDGDVPKGGRGGLGKMAPGRRRSWVRSG